MVLSAARQLSKQAVAFGPFQHATRGRGTAIRAALVLSIAAAAYYRPHFLFGKDEEGDAVGAFIAGLPEYSATEVGAHDSPEQRVWVTYRRGVYDITDFIAKHPGGGEKISLAAGGSIEPFWKFYQQHGKHSTRAMLESMRIGNLKQSDTIAEEHLHDPYRREPERSTVLKVSCTKTVQWQEQRGA